MHSLPSVTETAIERLLGHEALPDLVVLLLEP